jgi:hypothetical protein
MARKEPVKITPGYQYENHLRSSSYGNTGQKSQNSDIMKPFQIDANTHRRILRDDIFRFLSSEEFTFPIHIGKVNSSNQEPPDEINELPI